MLLGVVSRRVSVRMSKILYLTFIGCNVMIWWHGDVTNTCNMEGTQLSEIGWEGVDWIHLAQDRNQRWTVVNTVMNFRFP